MIGMIMFFEDTPQMLDPGYPENWFDRLRIRARTYGCTHFGVVDYTTYKTGQYYNHQDANIDYFYWQDMSSAETALSSAGFTPWYISERFELINRGISHFQLQQISTVPAGDHAFIIGPDDDLLYDLYTGRESENWIGIPTPAGIEPLAEDLMTAVFWHRYLVEQGII
jgi:hypothetical protein